MFITGYHGTTQEAADKIMKDKSFIPSTSDKDWLGPGIYFYPSIAAAYNWRNSEAIIHSVIKIDNDQYLDLDTGRGKDLLNKVIDYICQSQHINMKAANIQQNQCAVMKILWDWYPEILVMAASFPTEPRKVKIFLDPRRKRKEFCIRDNSIIKYIQCIKRSDLDD